MSPYHRLVSLLALATLAASCGETGIRIPDAGPSDAMPSGSCLEAADHSDLEWLQENVFTPSCAAFTACHKGRALSAGGLNLEPGKVIENLLDQPSIEFPDDADKILVVAGSPETSYLMVMLGSREDELPEAGTMPFNNPLLCKPKRDAVERWIMSLTNEPDAGPTDAGAGDAGDLDAGASDAMQPDAS